MTSSEHSSERGGVKLGKRGTNKGNRVKRKAAVINSEQIDVYNSSKVSSADTQASIAQSGTTFQIQGGTDSLSMINQGGLPQLTVAFGIGSSGISSIPTINGITGVVPRRGRPPKNKNIPPQNAVKPLPAPQPQQQPSQEHPPTPTSQGNPIGQAVDTLISAIVSDCSSPGTLNHNTPSHAAEYSNFELHPTAALPSNNAVVKTEDNKQHTNSFSNLQEEIIQKPIEESPHHQADSFFHQSPVLLYHQSPQLMDYQSYVTPSSITQQNIS